MHAGSMDQDLKEYLEAMESRLGQRLETKIVAGQDTIINAVVRMLADQETRLSERIDERMRTMQTELLRGMEAFTAALSIRLRHIEADHSNLRAAADGRMEVLEKRLMQIEKRLGIEGLDNAV